jgi:hypothetical protein
VNGGWQTAFTDDSYQDTTERTARDVWTEIVQFGECDPTGRYRIVVDGQADKGDGVKPYRVVSSPFDVGAVRLEAGAPVVEGGVARVKARYPAPPPGSLIALPRLVQTGTATLRVGTELVTARPDGSGAFTAPVPAGASAELVSLHDGCGNSA